MDFRNWLEKNPRLVEWRQGARLAGEKRPGEFLRRLLGENEPRPVLVTGLPGWRLAGNVLCGERAVAEALGAPEAGLLAELTRRLESRIPSARPGEVFGDEEQAGVDLGMLPVWPSYAAEGGAYINSGVWRVRDPETGGNLSFHRFRILDEKHVVARLVENRGLHRALQRSGPGLETVICLGAPPAVLLAAAFSPPADVDELELAARLAGAPLALGNCRSVSLEVPASCEIILEGRFTGETAPEGPYVDITGTLDGVREQPVVEITRVAWRRDPLFHLLVPALQEHRTLMGLPRALGIFRAVNRVTRCRDVVLTAGGSGWLHAVVSISAPGDPRAGRRALEAAFEAHGSLKHCVVVDDDLDPRDPAAVEWALATRFQADRDLLLREDQPASSLDPSARHVHGRKSRGAKLGLDATVASTGRPRELFRRQS